MSFALLHPRDQIVATMDRIYSHDMTTTSGGNISVRDENGDVWITPARVDKGSLRPQDVVRIAPDGARQGIHPPSSEWPFHLNIYRVRPDVRAILHAHPGALVSFSICGQVPNTLLLPEARNVCGAVAFAAYALPGSRQLGENIAAQFAASAQPSCVVLENHGVVVGGTDLADAFQRFETLEFTAQTLLHASHLGSIHYLTDAQMRLQQRPRNTLPECRASAPSSREKEARKDICDFVQRAYAHRLVTSTWGSFSARLGDDAFVITPHRVDRKHMTLSDLVVVRDGCCVAGVHASRAVRLHRALYQAHPEFQAVVNAIPVHATAFSVSDCRLDTRTIPESYLFLKDVATIPFEQQYGDDVSAVARTVTPANPIALLRHNGALVAGRSVLDAFDRLEVLEATAAAILRARVLGSIQPMSDAVIEELRAAFAGM
jgi:L-fuculose-phosphate aldolase